MLCAYWIIYKYRCLKARVIKTNFLSNDIQKICIILAFLAKTIHKFILKSVNIEPKKIQMLKFINTELKSDSDSESSDSDSKSSVSESSDSDSDSNSKLSDSDSESSDSDLENLCFSSSVFS